MTERPTYLYVIGPTNTVEGPLKIGRTIDLYRKLQRLQYGNPIRLGHIHSVEVDPDHAVEAEDRVHRALKAHRLVGEWFAVSHRTAFYAVDEAVSITEARRRAL